MEGTGGQGVGRGPGTVSRQGLQGTLYSSLSSSAEAKTRSGREEWYVGGGENMGGAGGREGQVGEVLYEKNLSA